MIELHNPAGDVVLPHSADVRTCDVTMAGAAINTSRLTALLRRGVLLAHGRVCKPALTVVVHWPIDDRVGWSSDGNEDAPLLERQPGGDDGRRTVGLVDGDLDPQSSSPS